MPDPATSPAALGRFLFRPFGGEQDFPAMCACANACFAAEGVDIVRTVEDMVLDYGQFTDCRPHEDVWIAQDGDAIAGYVRCWTWVQADGLRLYAQLGFVAPPWRRQGLGQALQAWIEQRHRQMAERFPEAADHHHHAFVMHGQEGRAALLEKAGYRAVRYFFMMVRPSLDAISEFPLPPQFELRPALPEDYRTIWDAHLKSFQTHWGYSPQSEADYRAWLKGKNFQPHLWQVAWAKRSNEVAGQVRTFIDDDYNRAQGLRRGWTEFISVGQKWRRQGVARALISHSLQAQKAAGMNQSALGVDAENVSGANRVYEDCGFVVDKRNTVYRKPMQRG